MKPARSFRARYLFAKDEMLNLVDGRQAGGREIDILAVPCGLAREMFETARTLKDKKHPLYEKTAWHGLDLDPEIIAHLSRQAKESGHNMTFRCGDALLAKSYGREYDMIVSLGFGEFLDDDNPRVLQTGAGTPQTGRRVRHLGDQVAALLRLPAQEHRRASHLVPAGAAPAKPRHPGGFR